MVLGFFWGAVWGWVLGYLDPVPFTILSDLFGGDYHSRDMGAAIGFIGGAFKSMFSISETANTVNNARRVWKSEDR